MMRRVILSLIIAVLFLFAILIYLIPDVDVIFKSSSEQSDINVVVDGDAPIIRIFSPKNINYGANMDILVNYSVIDQSLNSVWYSLNGENNISINGNFFLNLAEGNYLLRIYANDSFGRNNFSEVSFSVNNSLLFCGDNTCSSNIGESCNTCSQDCGTCNPPGSSGTGSSGAGAGSGGSPENNASSISIERESLGLDEDSVRDKEIVSDINQKTNERRKITYFLIGIVIVLILAVAALISYSMFKNKRTSEEEEKFSEG